MFLEVLTMEQVNRVTIIGEEQGPRPEGRVISAVSWGIGEWIARNVAWDQHMVDSY